PDSAPEADPDGDGYSNLQEFVAGTGPKSAAEYFGVAIRASAAAQIVVSFPTVALGGAGYEQYTGRHYALEQTDAPGGPWSAVPGYTDILGTGQMVSYTETAPSAGCQYRAAVWLE
ncbi:MAG: hypothetical protein JXR37_19875, partial [Kiritimatiellae bacterium]|nr:hypothetical protein [Kiritimatiellia bacterium]